MDFPSPKKQNKNNVASVYFWCASVYASSTGNISGFKMFKGKLLL